MLNILLVYANVGIEFKSVELDAIAESCHQPVCTGNRHQLSFLDRMSYVEKDRHFRPI